MRIPKMEKQDSKYQKTEKYQSKKDSSIAYEIPEPKNIIPETPVKDPNKSETPKSLNKIQIDKPEKSSKTNFISLDLLLVLLTTVICIAFVLTPKLNSTIITIILGILLILFLPGYSLVAALYPKKNDLDGFERTSLSFGFPLIGLAIGIVVNNITPVTIGLTYMLIILSVFTIILILFAYFRRRRVPEDEKFYVNFMEVSKIKENLIQTRIKNSKNQSRNRKEEPNLLKKFQNQVPYQRIFY